MTEGHINTLLEAIPLPSVLIGRDERIQGANARAVALLGQGIQGRHFITAIRQPAVLDTIEACLSDHEPRQSRYLSSQDTQDTTFQISCSTVETDEGISVLLCFEDVTPLEQVDQMRRDFVANVSHELRTPAHCDLLGFIETIAGSRAQGRPQSCHRAFS